MPRGRKTADNTPRRILTTNLIQVKVTPFLTANLITKSIENSNLPGLKMRKKRDKTPSSKDTDSSDAKNRTPKEQELSKLRAAYKINKTGKRPRMSESEEADNSDDGNENDKTSSTDPNSDDARTPPKKRVVKTRNPKRRKKSLVQVQKIKEETASEQEAKKLSSPVRRLKSSRSGKTPSKLHLQKYNARTCKHYKKITTDTGTRTVREDLPFKAKGKPAKGEHKRRRKSEMLKVIRAQDQEYAGKHLRPYFNGWFYQP